MRALTANLDFFISPITGRIQGSGSLPNLAEDHIWIGDANDAPVARVEIKYKNLPDLREGYLIRGNSDGRPSQARHISRGNLPNLTAGAIWIGGDDIFDPDNFNRPTESGIIPILELEVQLAFAAAIEAQTLARVASAAAAAAAGLAAAAMGVAVDAVKRNGDTMTGLLILSGDAVDPNGAVTLSQMSSAIASGSAFKASCYAASTTSFTATYANGAAGVGATLTNTGTLAAFSIDGVNPPINSRVLIKDQASAAHNGCYTLTTVGSGAVAWVLTRSSDYNQASEVAPGDVFPIINGDINESTSWLQIDTMATMGTSPISFIQFSYNANSFLQVLNNLSDLNDAPTARVNLGLTNVSIQSVTDHSVLIGGASDSITSIAVPATANQVLLSGASADPVWSTATYPAATTVSQILYSLADNVIAGLATGNDGVLITSGAGVPSISSTIPSAAQLNITSVGTVTTGTWNASVISLTYGGTNAALIASDGGIVYSTATAMAILAGTATANQVLLSGLSTAPAWSTATYPATTTINQILYSSSANVIAGLATANNAVLITDGSGVPALSSTPSGLTSLGVGNISLSGNTISSTNANGNINIIPNGSGEVILKADAVSALGAVTYQQLTASSSNLTFKNACYAATTANLTATYANGASGVGATLTNSGALAAFSVDGTSPTSGSRILVKNQSSTLQNGIYSLTTVGSGAIAWVLTRVTDYNAASQMNPGDFIIIENGTLNGETSWTQTATVSTIGTSPILFSSFTTKLASGTVTSDSVLVGGSGNEISSIAVPSVSNKIFLSGASTTPFWSTAVYPTSTTVNELLYSSSNNTVVGLATALSSILVTDGSGVPSFSTNLPSGVQTNITSLGTVTTGTWNASVISLTYGGTNAALTASNGGIVYSTATAMAILAGTATANQVLLSGLSTAPAWSTATYPATTTINQILYSSSANVIAGLATGNNGVLITSAGGVPSISSTIPSATQLNITSVGTVTTGSWNASVISLTYGGTNAALTASNGGIVYSTATAMAILAGTATARQMLQSGASGAPAWSTATYPATTTVSQILYSSSANVIAGLATANNAVVITNGSGVPALSSTPSGLTSIGVGNLSLSGNTLSSTDANGNINLTPNGTGQVLLKADATTALGALTYEQLLYINYKGSCFAATTANLTATYANGASGVGATLTNSGALAAFSVDGQSPAAGARILVKNQSSTFQNGIYTVTTVGSGAVAWVLTRSIDYNVVAYINSGDLILVINGTANAHTSWMQTTTMVTIGTTAVTFIVFTTSIASESVTQYAVLVGGALNTITSIAVPATANQVLLSGASVDPAWSTATYPATTTVNQILYSSSANVVAGLATGNNGVLITSAGGVPSISSTIPSATQLNITSLGTVTTGVWNATDIGLAYGGTNASLTASNGGIVYSTATAMAILSGTATARQMLQSGASGAPAWSTATYPATTTTNRILYSSSTNTVGQITTANNGVLITSGSGVPSISSTIPSATQLNITSLGTVTTGVWNATDIALADGGTNASLTASNGGIVYSTATAMAILAGTATANQVLLSGLSTAPAWSTATYPATTTINQILYSSSANVIAGLATANNGVLITSAGGVPSILVGPATANQVLLSGGGAPAVWSTATYPATTTVSQILYSSSTNVVAGLSTANSSMLVTDSSGVPSWSSSPTVVLTDSFTMSKNSTDTWVANTDPTDSGRYLIVENISTTGAASEFANITLQLWPAGTIGTGRCLADIRLVRTTLNNSDSTFLFSNFDDLGNYKDVLSLGNNVTQLYTTTFSVGVSGTNVLLTTSSGGNNYIQSGITTSSGSKAPLIFGNMLNANEWARFDENGVLLIGQTSTTASAGILQVTGGITFPSSPTPSPNANTLSDYAFGTYTPSFVNGTFTYTSREGGYVKIGAFVYAYAKIVWATNTGATGLDIAITLPFSTSGKTNGGMLVSNTNVNITAANSAGFGFQAGNSSSSMTLYYMASGVTTSVKNQNLSGTGTIHAIFTYSSGYTI